MSIRDRKSRPVRRKPGTRPIACTNHQPTYEPDCLQCRSLLIMILRARGDDL